MKTIDEKIEKAKTACLDLLKPSKRDLDHGLALHKESIVFDFYGLEPSCSRDPELYHKIINGGIAVNEIETLLEDMRVFQIITNSKVKKEHEKVWDASGVNCLGQNIGRNAFPKAEDFFSLYDS